MNKNLAIQRLFIVALIVSVVFLSVVFGMVAYKFKIWPYPVFQNAYKAAQAWYVRIMPYEPPYAKSDRKSGIFRYNEEKAYNGLTLFTSGHAQKAFLMSMDGQIRHEWHLPFYEVWSNPPHIASPLPDAFIYWRNAYLYPNGDLLTIYIANGDTPWGYGLVKVDKDSKIIWKYAERVHHDFWVSSDGKIYTLIHEIITDKIPGVKLSPPLIEDSIVVLSPEGQELKRLSISKAFFNSDFSTVLRKDPVANRQGDLWHANTVEVLEEAIAEKFPFLKKGQVLVSLKMIDTIAVIDLDQEQVVWAIRGPWHWQHDPDFLPNGNILIFDNLGYHGKGGASRIIEFNPTTMEILWQYTGSEKDIFFTAAKGAQQRLPNGNTLITSSAQGRLFEVTRENEVVWEFISSFRSKKNNEQVANVHWGKRFPSDFLTFEFSNKNQD
jgi:outer membrane protein assembly factor BamB